MSSSTRPSQDIEDVELKPDLTYAEYPIRVLDQRNRVTRRTTTKWYKVQWSQHSEEEATWESEANGEFS